MIPPEWIPSGPVDALGKYYGGLILPALQAPRNLAMQPFGGGEAANQWWAELEKKNIAEFESGPGIFRRDDSWQIKNPIGYALAKSGIGQFGFETVTDPLTYAGGLGMVPKVGKPALGLFNKVIEEALLAPVKMPMRLANIPTPGIGRLLSRKVTDNAGAVTDVPSKSVGDFLWGGDSRASQLSTYTQQMQDMAERLMGKGHDLDLDMADMVNARGGGIVEKFDPATARQKIMDMQAEVRSRFSTLPPAVGNAIRQSQGEHLLNIDRTLTPDKAYAEAYKILRASDDIVTRATRGDLDETQILDAFDRRKAALDFLEEGRTGILADLPESSRAMAEPTFEALSTHGKQLHSARDTLESGISEVWNLRNTQSGGTLGNYVPISRNATGDDAIKAINSKLTGMGLDPIVPTKESTLSSQLRARLAGSGQVSDTTLGQTDDVLKTWGASGDPITENMYKLVFDRAARDRANTLGLGPNETPIIGKFMDWMNDATKAWRSIQLFSPGYLSTNVGGGLAMSALGGVDPRGISRNLMQNMFKMLKGEFSEIPEITAQNKQLGLQTPAGLTGSTGFLQDATDLREISGKGTDVIQRIGAGPLAAAGAIEGGAAGYGAAQLTEGDDNWQKTALGAATGAATFGTMPWLSKRLYQPLAQGSEQVLRQSAGVLAREKHITENLPAMTKIVDDALLGIPVGPGVRDNIVQAVESRSGMISSKEIDQLLAGANVPPAIRRQATQQWDTALAGSDEAALGLSNKINFDYRNLTNIEEFMRQVLPFSTWGTKAIPFFAQRIAENPIIGSTIARFEEESERARKDQGLSPRFAGSVEVPAAQQLWSALTGREGQRAFFNPKRGFTPASDASRATAFERDSGTAWQGLTDVLDIPGYGVHPALGLLARLTGQEGTDPSQGPFPVRQAGPVNAVTGIDLNQPGRFLETQVRRGLGQPEVSDPLQQATLRRIDELALQKTGKPITTQEDPALAEYIRAKVDRSGPVWDQATREVSGERNTRSLVGFGSQMLAPQATLSPEEARISQARAGLLVPADISREITRASQTAPHTRASDKAIQSAHQAALTLVQQNRPDLNGQLPPELAPLFANPTWQNLDRIRDMVFDAQSQADPLVRGYAGSGAPEKQRLQHVVQLYQDTVAVALANSRYKSLTPEAQNTLAHALEAYPKYPREVQMSALRVWPELAQMQKNVAAEREKLLRENPDLQAYFDYRKSAGPDASLEAFLSRPRN